jgi:hypothetical protein
VKQSNIHHVGLLNKLLVGNPQIACPPQELSEQQTEQLWNIFTQIGEHWKDTHNASKNLRSSWLEMVKVKTTEQPSYYAEYVNAIAVMHELSEIYGEDEAFEKIFFEYKIPTDPQTSKKLDLSTLISHCKYYVIDEFIRMQVLAGAFKHFGGESKQNDTNETIKVKGVNYKGFIKGSRYANHSLVRTYIPSKEDK